VEAIMNRALALDESYDEGALHEFFVLYHGSRSEAQGGGAKRARGHFQRALALAHNRKLSPLVSYAETVSVETQNKAEFTQLLKQVIAADVDRHPNYRLVNMLAQRRAQWLLGRVSELFVE
jgi:predicted anti-sigma-YlaC factor YlaD